MAAVRKKLEESPADSQIDYAFELCTARMPSKSERQRLRDLITEQSAEYKTAPNEAQAIVAAKPPAGMDVKQLAAWTTAARVLLNLDETITRE